MNNQSKQFSEKYEFCSFEITLGSSYHDDILEGNIYFFNYDFNGEEEVKVDLCNASFYIFNAYNLEDVVFLADHISSDLEFVASSFRNYCDDFLGMGSIVIIDELNLLEDLPVLNERILSIKYFLTNIMKNLQIIGTGTILFMSKSLILNLKESDRVILINSLLDLNIIPIYQDESDVVLARNLDYIINY